MEHTSHVIIILRCIVKILGDVSDGKGWLENRSRVEIWQIQWCNIIGGVERGREEWECGLIDDEVNGRL